MFEIHIYLWAYLYFFYRTDNLYSVKAICIVYDWFTTMYKHKTMGTLFLDSSKA